MENAAGERGQRRPNNGLVSLFLCLGVWLLVSEPGMQWLHSAASTVTNIGVSLGVLEFVEPDEAASRTTTITTSNRQYELDGKSMPL